MNEVFGVLAGIGTLAAGFGFAYAQFKSGASKAKDDLLDTYREQIEVEKKKVESLTQEKNTLIISHQDQINSLNKEIGKLTGIVESQDKKLKEYTTILQGRSPEQTQFMTYITTVASESTKYMKETSGILTEIKTFMQNINVELARIKV